LSPLSRSIAQAAVQLGGMWKPQQPASTIGRTEVVESSNYHLVANQCNTKVGTTGSHWNKRAVRPTWRSP
jgi:hypothetical protein